LRGYKDAKNIPVASRQDLLDEMKVALDQANA